MNLGTAFANFFRDREKPRKQRKFRYPKLKKKRLNESFDLWVDQFDLGWDRVRIPKVGSVRTRENLRLCGVVMGATVTFSGGRWFISMRVDTDGNRDPAPVGTICGVDLGSRTLPTIAGDGNEIESETAPKPRKRLLGRIKRLQRRIRLQKHRANKTGQQGSWRQYVRQLRLSRLHARLANIRKDAAHGAVLDRCFAEIRRQLLYKVGMRSGRIIVADRFFPSTQVCPSCGWLTGPKGCEGSDVERWICSDCGAEHGPGSDAAINLRNLAEARLNARGHGAPTARANVSASAVAEPRTQTVRTYAHI